jgi:hypothetical protein
MEIKVGYMVAYDYEFLKVSIPTVYSAADKIVLAFDKDRKTFKGKTYSIDSSFFQWLKTMDVDKKIEIYEDAFFVEGLTVEQMDTRTRNLLGKFMGEGGWHFQVDADEYFINFQRVVDDVIKTGKNFKNERVTFRIYWCTIFKRTEKGFFLVDKSFENFALATNYPVYESMRYNHSQQNITLNHVALHQSFGRSEEELENKFRNWSHADDFDPDAYLRFWRSVNQDNYKYIYDFNATHPGHWMRLRYVEAGSLEELMTFIPDHYELPEPEPLHKLKKWIPPVIFNRLKKVV